MPRGPSRSNSTVRIRSSADAGRSLIRGGFGTGSHRARSIPAPDAVPSHPRASELLEPGSCGTSWASSHCCRGPLLGCKPKAGRPTSRASVRRRPTTPRWDGVPWLLARSAGFAARSGAPAACLPAGPTPTLQAGRAMPTVTAGIRSPQRYRTIRAEPPIRAPGRPRTIGATT